MPSSHELNPQQLQAVNHGEGPLLIIAGPGSGKTRVITERIVHLLEGNRGGAHRGTDFRDEARVRPENILALTFTEKAAEEMQRRVREALPQIETTPHISTFHSFCYEVLRKRHFERVLLDKVDVWIFLRRRMEKLELEFYRKLAEPGAFLHSLNDFFSRCQDELLEPEDFQKYVRQIENAFLGRAPRLDAAERKLRQDELQKKQELARVFRNSRTLIEEAGCSSLGSLIPETVHLFDREPEVAQHYRERFRYVLVDEFQDTNYAQVELLRRLVEPPCNITAVGDDDQAIYRFRGASHGAFEMFDDAFPAYKTVYLNRNYRSTQRILRIADTVIARNNRYRLKPELHTEKNEGERVFFVQSSDYLSEARWIAGEVERLKGLGTPLGEIAVLYRAHSYRDPLVEEFRRRGIPFAIRGLSLLSTIILRDLLAYLNVIHSPHDNISLTRVLLMPRWNLPEGVALEVRQEASRKRCSLFDVLESWQRASAPSRLAGTGWAELRGLLQGLRKFGEHAPVTALLDRLLEHLAVAYLPGDPDQSYVHAFRKFLELWEAKSETRKLAEFMEYFPYFREAGGTIDAPESASPRTDAVQMMTVHAAKGLEFSVVFVLSVASRRFPHFEQKPVIEFPEELRKGPKPPENIHEQEERRLFYVALTRAKERLYISSVAKPGKKLSIFVDDLLKSLVVAARDLEKIEAPEAVPERAPLPPPPARRPDSAPSPQGNLFSDAPHPGSVHPPLVEWAVRQLADTAPGGKLRLSASAIETYEDCPQKFKFSHYLKIPTGPQAALTFGNIMHQCVRHYFELRKKGEARFEDLQNFYLRSWKDAGFQDEYQEQAYKKAGLEQLGEFVKRQEKNTVLPLGMETHFALDLGDVTLEGRIDQINPLQDHAVELVDYKTGRPPSQRDADQSLQLSVYALAAREQMKLAPSRLTFYSLTSNTPVSTVRTPKDLEEVRAQVHEVAEQIRQQVFPPKPGFVCKYCDYVMVCPAHEEEF